MDLYASADDISPNKVRFFVSGHRGVIASSDSNKGGLFFTAEEGLDTVLESLQEDEEGAQPGDGDF